MTHHLAEEDLHFYLRSRLDHCHHVRYDEAVLRQGPRVAAVLNHLA